MVYVLGTDPLTGNVYEYEPKRNRECVVMRTATMRVNQGDLKSFLHKITFGHYSPRIQFNTKMVKTLIKEYK